MASLPHSGEVLDDYAVDSLLHRSYLMVPKGQLWWLLVASADGPELGAERADEGTEEKVKSRQLGGMQCKDAEASRSDEREGTAAEGSGSTDYRQPQRCGARQSVAKRGGPVQR